jgi:uncharacterized RDD family membrane protein YckC
MTCTVCGKPYPCAHSRRNTAALLEPDLTSSAAVAAESTAPNRLSPTEVLDRAERERWRREVISRVQQHRARRRRFDPNASLDLEFPSEEATAHTSTIALEQTPILPVEDDNATIVGQVEKASVRSRPPKIIRFPRQSALEAAAAFRSKQEDFQLADPVLETPRILDEPEAAPVAEQMDLLESFADIHLEPPQPSANDLPLAPQPALLRQRLLSGLMDVVIVLAAATMFAMTFVKLAEVVPASRLAGLCALAVGTTIWLMFQYVFLVYGQGTPGMHVSGLELCNFTGHHASRFARRCRALATVLSGLSLGLGFAWSLVDEDTLGWHDRISGTYLRSGDRVIG